jgi:hypothetical protein
MWSVGVMILTAENRSTWEKILSQGRKTHKDRPRIEPGPPH